MRAWPQILFIGVTSFMWGTVEARLSLQLMGLYKDIAVLVALWAAVYFVTLRLTSPHTGNSGSRRLLYFASALLSTTAITLVTSNGGLAYSMLAYLLATAALAMGASASVSSILRGDPQEDLPALIARLKVYPAIASSLVGILYSTAPLPIALAPASAFILAVVLAGRDRSPIIPALTYELLDRFTRALVNPGRATPEGVSVPVTAAILALLSVAKFIYMPSAVSEDVYMGVALYTAALAMGAIMGMAINSRRLLFTVLLASSIAVLLVEPGTYKFTIIAGLHALTDINTMFTVMSLHPSKLSLISWRTTLSLLAFSGMLLIVSWVYGRAEPVVGFLLVGLSALGLASQGRVKVSWE